MAARQNIEAHRKVIMSHGVCSKRMYVRFVV